MAAATSAFTPLSVPAHEDTMDMSSPARRQPDDDIDIDIDFTYGDDTLVDDDQMLDDDQIRPHTATDTAMDDDAGQEVTLVPEADMIDDPPAFVPDGRPAEEEDDDLIDYGDDDYNIVDEAVHGVEPEEPVVPSTLPEQQQDVTHDAADEGSVPQPGDVTAVELEPAETLVDVKQDDVGDLDRDRKRSASPSPDDGLNPMPGEQDSMPVKQAVESVGSSGPVGEPSHEEETADTTDVGQHEDVEDAAPAVYEAAQAAISVNTHVSQVSDGPATPTDTGLHPMVMQFRDAEVPLFRSRHQPQGLLTNDNLAGHHLADLIASCRERLQEMTGTVFSENQECTLQFQGLPLNVGQSSKAAYKCTLNDVLNVYLHLHHNAGTEVIPPLFLTLTTPESFTDVLQSLRAAAESGQGIPNIQYYQADEDEEKYPDDADVEEVGDYSHDAPYDEEYQQDDEAGEVDTAGQDEEFYVEGDTYEYQGEYEAAEQGDIQHSEHEDLDGHEEAGGHPEDSPHEDVPASGSPPVAPATPNEQTAPKDDENAQASANGGNPKALSPGSSATAQDDHQDSTADATDERDAEISAVPVEIDSAAETGPGDSVDGVNADAAASEQHAAVHDLPLNQFEAEAVAAEDFADLEDHEVDDDDLDEDEEFEHGATYDPADTDDGQQEEHHPGGDDELYHTARDFLDGDAQQHETEEPGRTGKDAQAEDRRAQALETFDDPNELIDFDDDTPAEHEARKASPLLTPGAAADSPLGKRSFDDHAETDLYDDDEPELKKARAK